AETAKIRGYWRKVQPWRDQMTDNNTRAIAALHDIMLSEDETKLRRRIVAAEQLLDYEAPEEIVADTKAFLLFVAESKEMDDDYRLDALKLLRKAEARKVVPPKATVRNNAASLETRREIEIAERRMALWKAGAWPPPKGWCADLIGPDYVPMPTKND